MKNVVSRRSFVGGAATIAAISATGLHKKPAAAQAKKVLRFRFARDITSLDPGYTVGNEGIIFGVVLPRLALYKPGDKWDWQPNTDFVSKLVHTDDLNIAFTVKPGLRWSKGFGEFTADDVKYSFERMKQSDYKGKYSAMEKVNLIDKYNGVIVMNTPFAPIWLTTFANALGSVVCKAAVEKLEPDAKSGVKKFSSEFPAQLGSLMMTEWAPKQKIVLQRNPDWKGTAAGFDQVDMLIVEDTKVAELAFEAGELDFTEVATDSIPRYSKTPPKNGKLLLRPGINYVWLGMNTEHPKLADIRVRKAIQRAVNTETVLQGAYAGITPQSFGVIPPGIIGKRTATKYKYDVNAAKTLMKEAGVSDLTLELKTLNLTDRIAAAQIIQANLAQIGVKVVITPVDSGIFWNLGIETKGEDWKGLQLWLMRYGGSPDPTDVFQWFVKSQVGIWNWERWSDPEFEDIYKRGTAERDVAKRNTMYLRMQEIMEDTGAYVWLTHEPAGVIHRTNIQPDVNLRGEPYLPWFKSV